MSLEAAVDFLLDVIHPGSDHTLGESWGVNDDGFPTTDPKAGGHTFPPPTLHVGVDFLEDDFDLRTYFGLVGHFYRILHEILDHIQNPRSL